MLILQPGVMAFYSAELHAGEHKHSAVQVVWPVAAGGWQLDQTDASPSEQPMLIASGVRHELRAKQCWVILLERHSRAGRAATKLLGDHTAFTLQEEPLEQAMIVQNPAHMLGALAGLLGVSAQAFNPQPDDVRLRRLVAQLDQCFVQGCVKPEQWRAGEIAADLGLSESRFLHLFRQHMEIPWRPYLLWRRLLCACNGLRTGKSATAAALDAGFSDSAHLSRTFRAYFGMSVREALTMAK